MPWAYGKHVINVKRPLANAVCKIMTRFADSLSFFPAFSNAWAAPEVASTIIEYSYIP